MVYSKDVEKHFLPLFFFACHSTDFIESLVDNEFHIGCCGIKRCFSSVKMAEYSPNAVNNFQACFVFGSGQIDSQKNPSPCSMNRTGFQRSK